MGKRQLLFSEYRVPVWGDEKVLETDRDHSVVFEIASKYCISDSLVDHDGHSISSEE